MTYRRSRGQSKGPCPACGEGDSHPSGSVCHDCKQLLEDGRAYRAETTKRLARLEGPRVYGWTERDWGFPGYYSSVYDFEHAYGDDAKDARRILQAAMYALVNTCSEPAPPGTPRRTGKNHDAWPDVLSQKGRWDWHEPLVLMPSAVRDAIDTLDQAVRVALTSAYAAGKAYGSSVLRQLADGAIGTQKFDAVRAPEEDDDE